MKKSTFLSVTIFPLIFGFYPLLAQVQLGADIYGSIVGGGLGQAIALSADGSRMAVSAADSDDSSAEMGYVQILRFSEGIAAAVAGSFPKLARARLLLGFEQQLQTVVGDPWREFGLVAVV